MAKYIVYGGCLDTPLDFPQLPVAAADAHPTWTLRIEDSVSDDGELQFLGENPITDEVSARLYRAGDGFCLKYDDSGEFHISSEGSKIRWVPGPETVQDNAREDIVGPVLACAMHLTGLLCLHGSSIVLPEGAVAFLGPKHHGKSTLAMAAIRRGAMLLADDCIPVDLGPDVRAYPGVAAIRFWDDTRRRLFEDGTTVVSAGGKHTTADLGEQAELLESRSMRAIYVLAPADPDTMQMAAQRNRLSSIESVLALVANAKVAALLGKSEAGALFDRASTVAEQVPVYQLVVARDFDQLDAIVSQLYEWHPTAESPAAS